jgi:hypothetical protein
MSRGDYFSRAGLARALVIVANDFSNPADKKR